MTLKVTINKFFNKEEYDNVEKLFIPSLLGDATILENHMSMVSQIEGDLEIIFSNGKSEKIIVNNAILSVDKDKVEVFF